MPASTSSSGATPAVAQKSQMTLNLQELLGDLFLVLTQKETEVIKRRFALAGQSKQKLTKSSGLSATFGQRCLTQPP
jgi:DNA-directed RNA polymerase sigma subunit (sigma70/sigma32)